MPTATCLTESAYFAFKRAAGAISQSELKAFADDPEGYSLGLAKAQSDTMKWGTLLDCLLLYPEQSRECIAVSPYDEFRAKEAKAWRAEQVEKGLMVVKPAQLREAMETIRALARNSDVVDALFGGRRKELYIAADLSYAGAAISASPVDPGTGALDPLLWALREHRTFTAQLAVSCSVRDVPFAAKLDILPTADSPLAGCIVDLKATTQFSPREYRRTFERFRYHWQGASYCDAYSAATGDQRDTFVHLIVEQKTGRAALKPIDAADMQRGRREYQAAIANLLHCRETGHWPGPWDDVETIGCSEWYREYGLMPGVEGL